MNYLHIPDKCTYKKRKFCTECLKTSPDCKLSRIIVDASVIISHYSEDQNSKIAKEIIDKHRKEYRLTYTHTIFAEIILGLKKLDDDNKLGLINNFLEQKRDFEIIEEPFDKKFTNICNEIIGLKLFSENRDLKMCATTLYYGYKLASVDNRLKSDIENINSALKNINKLVLELKPIKLV